MSPPVDEMPLSLRESELPISFKQACLSSENEMKLGESVIKMYGHGNLSIDESADFAFEKAGAPNNQQ